MPYTAEKPNLTPSSEELRATIPGWGADLDHKDRPSVPRERTDLVSGAHWDFPERQEELVPRERSIEHMQLTPVFGTSVPLKGLSGVVRRIAYDRFSEARAAHWLLLIAGDRLDAMESHLASFVSGKPDNLLTETGVLSELKVGGPLVRLRSQRADLRHIWMDPIIVAGPWVLAAAGVVLAGRAAVKAVRK
jgi:hypothetical protein